MLNPSSLNLTGNASAIETISFYTYQTLLDVQQQQPELLLEKYRNIPWQAVRNQEIFLKKTQAALAKASSESEIVASASNLLKSLLADDFFQSLFFENLVKEIKQAVQPDAQINIADGTGTVGKLEAEEGIAILLLDAENLQLSSETEKFLAQICHFPVQIKIAFANWRNMGKQDVDLHNRGYELIHVPAGKDSADVKMATVGSSIFIHYPKAKEVLVCSSDRVMTHLSTTLQTHGLNVYLVRQQGDNLTAVNCQTGESQTRSLKPAIEIPTPEKFIAQLKEIVQSEQAASSNSWIRLSRISKVFRDRYKLNISQILNSYKPGNNQKVKDLLAEYTTDFAIHQPLDELDLYITIFQSPLEVTANKSGEQPITSNVENAISQPQAETPLAPINSIADLEQALVEIINNLAKSSGQFVNLGNVGGEFNKQRNQPITQVIKRLQAGSNLIKFLQSRQIFKVEKISNQYQVAVLASGKDKIAAIAPPLPINSLADLEQILVNIILDLAKPSGAFVPLSNIGTKFNQQYKCGISHALKQLQSEEKPIQFLQSRPAFKLEKNGNQYQVAIANRQQS